MPKGVYQRAPRERKLYDPALVAEVARLYGAGSSQGEVAAAVGLTQKVIHNLMGRHNIPRRPAIKRDQTGARNAFWKGDDAGYQALHIRLYKLFGRPEHCSVCGTREAKAFDYANLTGNYTDPNDFAPMCRSCHHKFDGRAANFNGKG